MKLNYTEKPETNKTKLSITVEKDEFEAALEKSYRKNAKNFHVQGFRRGKAPRKMIERIYGASAFYEDAINIAFPEVYEKAVKEAGIVPVDRPELELGEINADGFTFLATITTKPEVKLSQYKGLEAQYSIAEVTEEDVEKELQLRRRRSSRLEKVDRPAKNDDVVLIDYQGFMDGVPFEGGSAEQHKLKLGSGMFIPGFEEQLIGASAGDEVEVKVTFPEDSRHEELAGKDAVFNVKVHDVKEELLPELDDEFAKDISEFETLNELRDDIRAKLKEARTANAEAEFENALVDKLIEGMEAEIPECMIEQQLDRITDDFSYRLRAQGMTLEAYLKMSDMDMDSFRKTFRSRAERQVKTSLALEEVARLEGIEIGAEDLEAEYKRLSEQVFKTDIDEVKKYMPEEAVSEDMIRAKAIELVKSTAAKLLPEKKKAQDGGKTEKKTQDGDKPAKAVKTQAKPKTEKKPKTNGAKAESSGKTQAKDSAEAKDSE
jgi:trigger factor